MRLPMLAVLGLMLTAGPALALAPPHQPAAPAKASLGKASPTKATPARATATSGRPGAAQARPAAGPGKARLQQAAWRPGACSRRARQCQGTGVAKARFGWTQGLPPAALVQTNQCPDGTMATLARGHEDVIRCMPI